MSRFARAPSNIACKSTLDFNGVFSPVSGGFVRWQGEGGCSRWWGRASDPAKVLNSSSSFTSSYVRVPWSEIDRKSMNNFQQRFFQFLAVLAKKIWKIKSKKNPPNIMALPNPFQNTFNAPPWPSQVDPSKFGCIWTPRNDFFDGLCITHRKKSPAARAKRHQRQSVVTAALLLRISRQDRFNT